MTSSRRDPGHGREYPFFDEFFRVESDVAVRCIDVNNSSEQKKEEEEEKRFVSFGRASKRVVVVVSSFVLYVRMRLTTCYTTSPGH